jgi:hypothetical protein
VGNMMLQKWKLGQHEQRARANEARRDAVEVSCDARESRHRDMLTRRLMHAGPVPPSQPTNKKLRRRKPLWATTLRRPRPSTR